MQAEEKGEYMPEMKRAIKGSVFTFLFSEPRYLLELYQYLHPEDADVTEAECKLITSKISSQMGSITILEFK